jgi:hypothetical protein
MKKVLLVFDGTNFSEGAFEFVRQLNELQSILVTALFVPQVDYANLWSYAATANAVSGAIYIPLLEDEEAEEITRNIERFELLCQKNGIKYRIHKDVFDFALPQLKKETRFADVVILGGEMFYKDVIESNQFLYLRDAVHVAECPVLIVPENYTFPDNNILAYDGSDESAYAIKQFAYIFPELAKNKTLLVYAEDEKEKDLPAKDQISELASQHFENLSFYKLEINPKRYFNTWISEKKGSLLVAGSFSRSAFSQLFKKSFVTDIVKDHKVPIFIAHK